MTLSAHQIVVRLGDKTALDGASLRVDGGKVVAIVGPNGAGKTTALRALCGLIEPEGGTVVLDDRLLSDYRPRQRAHGIAFVPQRFDFAFSFSVSEVVRMGTYAATDSSRLVEAAIDSCDLGTLAERDVTTLSSGEARRVMIARSLAQGATHVLLDEPTEALDLAHRLTIRRAVRRFVDQGGACIAVLHDLSEAAAWADEVVLLVAGRVLAAGPPRQVITAENLLEAYGVHATVQWLAQGLFIGLDESPALNPRPVP